MNTREMEVEARRLGAEVRCVRRTGERLLTHPAMSQRFRYNMRKKHAPISGVLWLKQLAALLEETCQGRESE